MNTTHDVTADIAAMNRKAYRGQVEHEAIGKALAELPNGSDAAADVLRAYHDRWHWLLCGEACEVWS